jgi:hypothetical protein
MQNDSGHRQYGPGFSWIKSAGLLSPVFLYMPLNPEIICVQIPPLIRIELKDKYTSWYERCIFTQNTEYLPDTMSLLILPSSMLLSIKNNFSYTKIITFGAAALLESSFLSGSDDYLKDPWDCSELLIRSSRFLNGKRIFIEDTEIICRRHNFYINKELIELTPVQGRVLSILFENPNVYFDCKELQEILPPGFISSKNSLYVQIHHIRKVLENKLPDIYGKSLILKNSNCRGYILFLPVDNLCKNVDKL